MIDSAPKMSEDERAAGLIATSIKMQEAFLGELLHAPVADKKIVVKKLVEYATFIGKDRRCAPGEIIWLRSTPFSMEHNITVLAAVSVLGENADKAGDWHGSRAAFLLRAMALISHAKTIAQSETVKTEAFVYSHTLGGIIDDLMKATKTE